MVLRQHRGCRGVPSGDPLGLPKEAPMPCGDPETVGESGTSLTPERRRIIFLKLLLMALLFVAAVGGLAALYLNLPGLSGEARAELAATLPSSFGDLGRLRELETLKKLRAAVGVYRQQQPVALAMVLAYLYLLYQSFPLFMFPFSGTATCVTVLLGALYDPWPAFLLASFLSALGPSIAYFLFKATGRPLVVRFFPDQLQRMRSFIHPAHSSSSSSNSRSSSFTGDNSSSSNRRGSRLNEKEKAGEATELLCLQQKQQEQQQQLKGRQMDLDLVLTLLFLRISPFPNLIVNAASPVLDVPFGAFFVATWLGLMPNAALLVSMGSALGSLESLSSGWKPLAVFLFGSVAVALLKAALNKARTLRLSEEQTAATASC